MLELLAAAIVRLLLELDALAKLELLELPLELELLLELLTATALLVACDDDRGVQHRQVRQLDPSPPVTSIRSSALNKRICSSCLHGRRHASSAAAALYHSRRDG